MPVNEGVEGSSTIPTRFDARQGRRAGPAAARGPRDLGTERNGPTLLLAMAGRMDGRTSA